MAFKPKFTISTKIANALMRIEAVKQSMQDLPITLSVLTSLRQSARLYSTHYSTLIEGNRLSQEEVTRVIDRHEHFQGRERDEKEVLGYYSALEKVEQIAANKNFITEQQVQMLHALVMAGGSKKASATPYRDGQNVIRDGRSREIVYLPPEAKDVPRLVKDLIAWLKVSEKEGLPCPVRAGMAHYQFATIHPYYDGNGRTARLLTTLVLHLGGYDLKGLYSLEEYYALDLQAYYEALTVGDSHNYYMGRAEADVTKWIEYFCEGVVVSFENVKRRALEASGKGAKDHSHLLRKLDPRQRKALELFEINDAITSRDVEKLFMISQRMARNLLSDWAQQGFLIVADPSKKSRKYALAPSFREILP
jgi:Fic family protein